MDNLITLNVDPVVFGLVLGVSLSIIGFYLARLRRKPPPAATDGDESSRARDRLAQLIPMTALVTLSLLAALAIMAVIDDVDQVSETTRYLFATLLPVFSAWVGAIIAYYFGKDNYESGVRGTRDVLKDLSLNERLSKVKASSVMIQASAIESLEMNKPATDYKVEGDVLDSYFNSGHRLPILDSAGKPRYVLHDSTLTGYLVKVRKGNPQLDPTLEDFFNDQVVSTFLAKSMKTVTLDATLADVKRVMDVDSECQDVFITDDGTANTSVKGWITDVMVRKYSNA